MIRIDQIVLDETRVIIRPGYASFSKDYWLYDEKWRDQDVVRGQNLVIGGEYSICDIQEGRYFFLQDRYAKYTANEFGVLAKELVLASDFTQCPYEAGDLVRPCREFNYADFGTGLPGYCDDYFSTRDRGHTVTGVLNGRYIFIDYEPLSDNSLPFPWDDFVPI